jgi:hypothetical protein
MHHVFRIRFISCRVIRWRVLSGRLTVSAACLHAVVLAFICLRVNAFSGKLRTPHKRGCFGTQAWQESLLIRRDATPTG